MASDFVAIHTHWGTELVKPIVTRDNVFYHQTIIHGEPQKDYGVSSDISGRLLLLGVSSKKKADELLSKLIGSGHNWHLSASQIMVLSHAEKRSMSLFLTSLIEHYGAQKP
jgi:hypothetical protein